MLGIFSADFFLSVEEGFGAVHLGDAEVLSYDESVCQPQLLGPASTSTMLSQAPARLAVTFDCKGMTLQRMIRYTDTANCYHS